MDANDYFLLGLLTVSTESLKAIIESVSDIEMGSMSDRPSSLLMQALSSLEAGKIALDKALEHISSMLATKEMAGDEELGEDIELEEDEEEFEDEGGKASC
jgi:hypothetical protein